MLTSLCSIYRENNSLRASAGKSHVLFQMGRAALLTVPCRQPGRWETNSPFLVSDSLGRWSDLLADRNLSSLTAPSLSLGPQRRGDLPGLGRLRNHFAPCLLLTYRSGRVDTEG